MTRHFPSGPTGSFFGMSLAREFSRDPLGFLTEVSRTYGDLAGLRMGPVKACLCNNPDLIREVLVTRARFFRKEPRTLNALRQIDGEGLVVTEGDFWLRQRRLLQPAFHPRRLGKYAATIVERTTQFLDRWKPGETRNIVDEMTHLTLEIIAKLFYDLELTGQASEMGEAVRTLSEIFAAELSTLIKVPDWVPTRTKRRKRWAIRTLDTLMRNTIRERRASGQDKGDLLSMLLMAVDEEGDGRGMSDQQARDEAITMFNAGHDSSAAGLAWAWHLISTHPEVERRLREEVATVLGDRPATAEDLPKLKYTDCVIRESLRLYPPVWILFVRQTVEDIELGNFQLPKGTWIYILPWVTQRDPRFFPDPLRFDPDRFSEERISSIPQYSWIPFGAGPHICIGQGLALAEMSLIVATTLQRFRLEAVPRTEPVVPEPLLAIRPKGGLMMTIRTKAG
ncbi:MAG: cytochrome P450 [Planctomycetaceae bacterium]|nr:cytochrome P450 [Planctomycetaceae bacterium]